MQINYLRDPLEIEKSSFQLIRKLVELESFTLEQQQVVMRIVHSLGIPEIAAQIRFSSNACIAGKQALAEDCPILCDVEMVKQGITKSLVTAEPICYLNNEVTVQRAITKEETRSMAAVEQWRHKLSGSVVVIGNAPTALFRLLEILHQGADKPALIIAMPVGFVGAAESKQALWDWHEQLEIDCITLLGREGGSAASAAACNALLRCNHGELY